MLRTALATAVATAALTVVPSGAPAEAKPSPDPLAGLTIHPEWGSITVKNGVLKRGCHTYTYSYSIDPPEGIWAIEVFITGPGVKHVAAGAFLDGYDPKNGSGRYTLCRNVTRYGTFRIETKLSTDDGAGHIKEGRLPDATFKLRRPKH